MYHRNEDLNIASQVNLMSKGKGLYHNMYNHMQKIVVTNAKGAVNTDNLSINFDKNLVLHPAVTGYESHVHFTSGILFTPAMLKCSAKNLSNDPCSGRFLIDLYK